VPIDHPRLIDDPKVNQYPAATKNNTQARLTGVDQASPVTPAHYHTGKYGIEG